MQIPSKEDIQELIEHFNKNRLSIPIVNKRDIEGSIKIALHGLMNARINFFAVMESNTAFQWVAIENKISFNKAVNIYFPKVDDEHEIEKISQVIINKYNKIDELNFSLDGRINQLKKDIINASVFLQRKESLISHILTCLMNYMYPTTILYPAEFKKEINQTIKSLQKAKEAEDKLNKYRDLFYKIDIPDNTIEEKLNFYSAIRDNGIFPVQKVSDKHNIRMFIIAVSKKFLVDEYLSKNDSPHEFKHILKFNMHLLGFSCFPDDAMEEVNVRNAINGEIERQIRDINLYESHQNPMPSYEASKHKLGKGLFTLINGK